MAEVNDLYRQIREGYGRLGDSMKAAESDWDDPIADGENGERWTVRQTVEHALETQLQFTAAVAAAIGADVPEPRELSLASLSEAEAAADEVKNACAPVYAALSPEDLEKPSAVMGDVFSSLVLTAHHLNLHSLQIAER